MLKKIIFLSLSLCFLCKSSAFISAQTLLSQKDLDHFADSYTAGAAHTSVSGAAQLGGLLLPVGVQLGLLGGVVSSEMMKDKFGDDYEMISRTGVLFMLGVPFGINGEFTYSPDMGWGKYKHSHSSFAIRWTITDLISVALPFSGALRLHYATSKLGFKAEFNNSSTVGINKTRDFEIDSSIQGADLLLSVSKIPFVEPYLGVGYIHRETTFSLINKDLEKYSIFDDNQAKKTGTKNHARFLGGIEVSLTLFRLGFEVNFINKNPSFFGKIGVGI